MSAPEEAFNEGTARPKIITAEVQLNAPFNLGKKHLHYTATWRAQWNKTPLIPQDRFSIGGRYTVRGLDGENQLLAERGWLIRNDVRWALGQIAQEVYFGIDYGQVSGVSSGSLISTHLSGTVLGLRGRFKDLFFDAFMGKPISKPNNFQTARSVSGFNLYWSF